LSDGQSNWQGARLRGEYDLRPGDVIAGEINFAHRFDDSGLLFGQVSSMTTAKHLSALWRECFDVGSFLAEVGGNTELFQKVGGHKNLVLGIGVGYFSYRTQTSDVQSLLEAIYYFAVPLVIEGGVRGNSRPTRQRRLRTGFLALTWVAEEVRAGTC